ncbi:predicted protein [Chaetoceros tenuissimus]|uniref:Uncharacterized protein n=1 Tax=Chaetoceros tenuissimus TaxID=426638 RepID=A0AAD3CYI9_9STRA|nr:predicted protein [Chaetoceros tenuissimus]
MKELAEIIEQFASSLHELNVNANVNDLIRDGVPGALLCLCNQPSVAKTLFLLTTNNELRSHLIENNGIQLLSSAMGDGVEHSRNTTVVSFIAKAIVNLVSDQNANLPARLPDIILDLLQVDCLEFVKECLSYLVGILANICRESKAKGAKVSKELPPLHGFDFNVDSIIALSSLIANSANGSVHLSSAYLQSGLIEKLLSRGIEMIQPSFDMNESVKKAAINLLIMLSNLPNSRQNASLVESHQDIVTFVKKILIISDDLEILERACKACQSICFYTNSARRAFGEEAFLGLMDIALRMGLHDETDIDRHESQVAIEACKALCSIVVDPMMKEKICSHVDDVESFLQLILETESTSVLQYSSMMASLLLPSLDEKKEMLVEGRTSIVENKGIKDVIERVIDECFYHDYNEMPHWLSLAKDVIELTLESGVRDAEKTKGSKLRSEEYEKCMDTLFNQQDLYESVTVKLVE